MFGLIRMDIRNIILNKKIWLFLGVVLIISIISTTFVVKESAAEKDTTLISIGVHDKDNSLYSNMVIDFFTSNETYASYIKLVAGNEEELKGLLQAGELDMYLVIPKDFVTNMIQIIHEPLRVVISGTDTTKAILMKNLLSSYEKYVSAVEINCVTLYEIMEKKQMPQELIDEKNVEISYQLIFTALGKEEFFHENPVEDIESVPLLRYYSYVLLFLFLSYSAVLSCIPVMREAQNGIYKRMKTTRTGVAVRVWSKMAVLLSFPVLLYVLISSIINYAVGRKMNIPVLILVLLSFLCMSSFSLLMSGLIKKTTPYLLSMNLIILLSTILGGGVIPLSYLPEMMQKLAGYTFPAWFMKHMIYLESMQVSFSYNLGYRMAGSFLILLTAGAILYQRREEPLESHG